MENFEVLFKVGKAIHAMLADDDRVAEKVTGIYPIVRRDANLPYIAYRRTGCQTTPEKRGRGANAVNLEVRCYARTYEESVNLASLVRDCLDAVRYDDGDICIRSIYLIDCYEDEAPDSTMQVLEFEIRL